jgi:hypothetical protein
MVERGKDDNSSSGSDDCPSDDNFSSAVLRHLIPLNPAKKRRPPGAKVKDQLCAIFGFRGASKSPDKTDSKSKSKLKEEKKKEPPQRLTKSPIRPPTVCVKKEKKEQKEQKEERPAVTLVDAWTQTERIDFAKARYNHKNNIVTR